MGEFLGSALLTDALGPVDAATAFAEVADVTSNAGFTSPDAAQHISNGTISAKGFPDVGHCDVGNAAKANDGKRLIPVRAQTHTFV